MNENDSFINQTKEILARVAAGFIEFTKSIWAIHEERKEIIKDFYKREDEKKLAILNSKIKNL
jgi:hypothetical protein